VACPAQGMARPRACATADCARDWTRLSRSATNACMQLRRRMMSRLAGGGLSLLVLLRGMPLRVMESCPCEQERLRRNDVQLETLQSQLQQMQLQQVMSASCNFQSAPRCFNLDHVSALSPDCVFNALLSRGDQN